MYLKTNIQRLTKHTTTNWWMPIGFVGANCKLAPAAVFVGTASYSPRIRQKVELQIAVAVLAELRTASQCSRSFGGTANCSSRFLCWNCKLQPLFLAGTVNAPQVKLNKTAVSMQMLNEPLQRSNAKIQRHILFSPPWTFWEFDAKICKTFLGKCYKNSTVK